jgi:hypothetical protein
MAKPRNDPFSARLTPLKSLAERAMEEETSPELAVERAVAAHWVEVAVRLRALLERYNLDEEEGPLLWLRLALALAFEHEEAFQEADDRNKGPGAPKKWTSRLELLLAAQVNELRADGYSVADACKRLENRPPWKSWQTRTWGETLTSSTLVQRYKAITRAEPQLSWNVVKGDPAKLSFDIFRARLENPDIANQEALAAIPEFQRRYPGIARHEIEAALTSLSTTDIGKRHLEAAIAEPKRSHRAT